MPFSEPKHDVPQQSRNLKHTTSLHQKPKSEDESTTKLKAEPTAMDVPVHEQPTPIFDTVNNSEPTGQAFRDVAQTSRGKSVDVGSRGGILYLKAELQKRREHDRFATAYMKSLDKDVEIPLCLLKGKPYLLRLFFPVSGTSSAVPRPSGPNEHALQNTTPPVTSDTLKELGLSAVQNNVTLRIDLVFDQGLYFQPITGSRGQEKQQQARVYWECLSLELKTYIHDLNGDCEVCAGNEGPKTRSIPSRLLKLFSTLRELLEILVPEAERQDVRARLDVEWYVKLVRTGQFDAGPFAGWLSKLITMHCAPMRDQMARDMHHKIAEGAELADMDVLVSGLSLLFNLLEKMKLDVANHQIRTFKYQLITDAVPFLRDCFSKMIRNKQFDISHTRAWFQNNLNLQKPKNSEARIVHSDQYFDIFVQAVVDLLKMGADEPTAIFNYDKERLDALRNDLMDVVQWDICENTLRELTQKFRRKEPSLAEIEDCSQRVLKLIMPDGGHNEGVDCHMRSVAVELARTAAGISSEEVTSASNFGTNIDQFNDAYCCLKLNLSTNHSAAEEDKMRSLSELVLKHAHRFNTMDTLQVSEEQRTWAERRSLKICPQGSDLEDIARRTAHIAVLSWQVWSDIAFLSHENPADIEPLQPHIASTTTVTTTSRILAL